MLNWILGAIAVLLWAVAYGWYHATDIGNAWTRWRARRAVARDMGK